MRELCAVTVSSLAMSAATTGTATCACPVALRSTVVLGVGVIEVGCCCPPPVLGIVTFIFNSPPHRWIC